MTEKHPTILVIDAHAVIGSAVAIALRHSGFAATRSVHPDQLQGAGEHGYRGVAPGDIVLLGVHGDDRTVLPLIQPLVHCGCRVVMVAVAADLPILRDCLRSGAEAVLDADMSFDRLLEDLRHLSTGGSLMTQQERVTLCDSVEQDHAALEALVLPFSTLTGREVDVLVALVEGHSPKHIARVEEISVSTVRGHIQRVLLKLRVNSEREALAMARRAGWPSVALVPDRPRSGSRQP